MCGIVGYIGKRNAYPILIGGLKRLEYRGYDSAGVALLDGNDSIKVIKEKGKVSQLEAKAAGLDTTGCVGIAHTRWATHGEPSTENAHPHLSMSGELALVHNGIIENYQLLKEQLIDKGYHFVGATDTEVLVNLIDLYYQNNGKDALKAVHYALEKVVGAYAISLIECHQPGHLIVARKSSPLVVGLTDDNSEFFIASDATPIVEYTKKVVYLNDEEIADIRLGQNIAISTIEDEAVDAEVKEVDLDISKLSKGGFPHFMLKEIFDQPDCLHDCMSGRLRMNADGTGRIVLSAVEQHKDRLMRARQITFVACGTSWHAALIGKQLIEKMCRVRVSVEYASEYRYNDPIITPDDVVIAVSQSGETADTLAAIELAKSKGAFIFGVVNSVGSSIARVSHTGVYIHVGPEIGVASTKAFTGQVTVLTLIALALGHELGTLPEEDYQQTIKELSLIPAKMRQVLTQDAKIAALSKHFTYAKNFIYLGRGFNFPVALEGALKLKEISYIHAEGYPAAEMKHGPIALVDAEMPIVFIATHHQLYQKVISNMQEVKSRNGRILAIVTEGDEQVKALVDNVVEVPDTLMALSPLLNVVPLQLLSYHVAVEKGLNVDMPRNLAKSVTVE